METKEQTHQQVNAPTSKAWQQVGTIKPVQIHFWVEVPKNPMLSSVVGIIRVFPQWIRWVGVGGVNVGEH